MEASIRSWLADLSSSDPAVRKRSLEAFMLMAEQADSALEGLVSERQTLELNPSEKTQALWGGFSEIVETSPSVFCSFLRVQPEMVEWLVSAPPDLFQIMRKHESNEIKEIWKRASEAYFDRLFPAK